MRGNVVSQDIELQFGMLTSPHLLILFLSVVRSEIFLNDHGGGAHLQESPPVVPAADAALQHEDLFREDAVPLLLEEQVLRVFQEHLKSVQIRLNQSVFQ